MTHFAPCSTAWERVRRARPDLELQNPPDTARSGPVLLEGAGGKRGDLDRGAFVSNPFAARAGVLVTNVPLNLQLGRNVVELFADFLTDALELFPLLADRLGLVE